MNKDLRRKSKNDFVNDFSKLMNIAVFGKTMENVRKNRDIKLATTERRKNYLVLEPSYYFTKFFTEKQLAIKMKKIQVYISKALVLVFKLFSIFSARIK